jgi:hypothetical protein
MPNSEDVCNIAVNKSVLNNVKGDQINQNIYIDHGKASELCDPRSESSVLHPGQVAPTSV